MTNDQLQAKSMKLSYKTSVLPEVWGFIYSCEVHGGFDLYDDEDGDDERLTLYINTDNVSSKEIQTW